MLRSVLLLGGALLLAGSALADEAVIYSLPANSRAAVGLLDDDGTLYGQAQCGGEISCGQKSSAGFVFQLRKRQGAWQEKTLYLFNGPDGQNPDAPLIVDDKTGVLYGTTTNGGQFGKGTVFSLTPAGSKWDETVLHSFTGARDGRNPEGQLAMDPTTGTIYGTSAGKPGACGHIFQMVQSAGSWAFTQLHTFRGASDGCTPEGGLEPGTSPGTYFGTTVRPYTLRNGQVVPQGTVYKLTISGTKAVEQVIWDRPSSGSGRFEITVVSDDLIYAARSGGGGEGRDGVVFQLQQTNGVWQETTLRIFNPDDAAGYYPSGLYYDKSTETIYGANEDGGSFEGGTHYDGALFKLTQVGQDWTETVLHNFDFTHGDGFNPIGPPIEDPRTETLYGTTLNGGQSGTGAVYSYSP